MSELIERAHRLHVDLQHLLVLTFPRNQETYRKYLKLLKARVLSQKLKTHPVYSEKIIEHLDVPTIVQYTNCKKKIILYKQWWEGAVFHREGDLPANVHWYKNGKVWTQEWYKHGKKHREKDLPSCQRWHKNGQLAFQNWWKEGTPHRGEDLPALQGWDENGQILFQEWWEKGVRVKQEIYN